MTRWAEISDMSLRFDVRVLGGLVSDTDTIVSPLTGNSVLNLALEEATGVVRSAVHVGREYTPEQMQQIVDSGNQFLVGLVCSLAMGKLYARRTRDIPAIVQRNIDEANDRLDELRKGHRVFDGVVNATAQNHAPYAVPLMTRQVNFPLSSSPLHPPMREPA